MDAVRELVSGAQQGDRRAFDLLVEGFRAPLRAAIRSRIGPTLRHEVDVDDLLQETFLRAFQSIGRFEWRDEGSFQRWLEGIAEHLIWNASQKRGRGRLRITEDHPDSDTSPSGHVRRNERFDRLEAALSRLSPDHRTAIQLARIEGLKVKEIAARMDRSPDAVKKLLARALARLRREFGDTESFHLPPRSLEARERSNEE